MLIPAFIVGVGSAPHGAETIGVKSTMDDAVVVDQGKRFIGDYCFELILGHACACQQEADPANC